MCELKNRIKVALRDQGYVVKNGLILLENSSIEGKRQAHQLSRREKVSQHIHFVESYRPKMEQYLRNSRDIEVKKIDPELREIYPNTEESKIFLWWNLVWWSLPYSRSYGRQMRFLVWDKYHDCPMGLFGLQSPLLSWSVRDNHLNIVYKDRDYWVNQSLSAQRLGALPPYNKFLGGKLIGSLMVSDEVRLAFAKKYDNRETVLKARKLPANLLFITTTGAYGKSSVYNRLKFHDEYICRFIGYTQGNGSFHIPDRLYEELIEYLRGNGYKAARTFGHGPSLRMRNISQAMQMLGYKNGSKHGMERAVYLFPMVKNLEQVIQHQAEPDWCRYDTSELTAFWQERWASKRIGDIKKTRFSKQGFKRKLTVDLANCAKLAASWAS